MNLETKVAVVTGGTKGIGRAIAESLLKAGARVFICARDKSELKRALEQLSALGKVDGEVCDVRSESLVEMMLKECVRVFGGVDILVNNAGIGIIGKTVEEMSAEDFENTLQLITVLTKHSSYVYTQIAQEAYKPKPKHKKEKFLDSLPAQFNRQTYVAIALSLGITDKSAQRYIKEFVDADIIQDGGHDKYINPNATNPQ